MSSHFQLRRRFALERWLFLDIVCRERFERKVAILCHVDDNISLFG